VAAVPAWSNGRYRIWEASIAAAKTTITEP
jgi:hypothetical protein